jgi:peptidoglycan DL-endopeptidase CwlO
VILWTQRTRGRSSQRRGASRVLLLVSALMLAMGLLFVSPNAIAEPPLTVAEAKAQIEQLETDASALDQSYVEIREQVKQGRAKLRTKQADTRKQVAKVDRLRRQVGEVALAQFQNRHLDTAARLIVAEDTSGFLSQVSTIENINENQNAVLQSLQQEQASLASLELSAKVDLAALADQEKELGKLRRASDKKVAEAKSVLAKLTEAQRRQIAAEEARAVADAREEAERPEATRSDTAESSKSDESSESAASSTPAGSGKGAVALAFARKQLGKPYRWGAAGPEAYDCSGLTMAAWRAAGVSLPRVSRQQATVGRAVTRSELQPGDLVFFYSPISHVSLYAGNGMILDAPRPGKTVRYLKMSYMPWAGARRPG